MAETTQDTTQAGRERYLEAPVTVEPKCSDCGRTFRLTVTASGLHDWKRGAFVQDAFPELSDGERELLISGICGECFDNLFAETDHG